MNLYLAITAPLLPERSHTGFPQCQPATAFLEQNMSFDRIRSGRVPGMRRLRFFKARLFENAVFPGGGEKDMRSRNCSFASMLVALVLGLAIIPSLAAEQNSPNDTQTTELYKMQAAFHRYATVHDPVLGDPAEVITQRIRDRCCLCGLPMQCCLSKASVPSMLFITSAMAIRMIRRRAPNPRAQRVLPRVRCASWTSNGLLDRFRRQTSSLC